ncbi:hypothetical protein GCM10027067_06860 [Pseudactinotalea suaedae]
MPGPGRTSERTGVAARATEVALDPPDMGSLSGKEEGCPEGGIRPDLLTVSTTPCTVLVKELRRAHTAVGAPCHALAIARSGVRPGAATAALVTALTPERGVPSVIFDSAAPPAPAPSCSRPDSGRVVS